MHIAIIGAGLAGLTCAVQLQARGHTVTLYESNAEAGGRMTTRETEFGGFDLGVQYFTARSALFQKQVAAWRKAGWLERWNGRLATLQQGIAQKRSANGDAVGAGQQRWAAVPGMNALCLQLARGLDLRTEQRVTAIEAAGKSWLLKVRCASVPIDATAGPFDVVLVALPVVPAAVLLQAVPALAKQAARVPVAPCWTLVLAFQDALPLTYDGAWVDGSRLGWIARDSAKPQRRPGERWIAHATPAWSREHLADDPERAREKLEKAFHEATGSLVQPVYSAVYRWRFAQSERVLGDACFWQSQQRIGACGDWFAAGLEQGSGRVENAYLSGLALAQRVG